MARRLPLIALTLVLVACGGASGAHTANEPATNTIESAGESSPPAATTPACPTEGVAVRVLGSGGPMIDDDRASSGYLVVVDGTPRLLVDAGGGVALRMAQASVDPARLDGVLLSHFHVDHSADLVSMLKSASFSGRSEPMTIAGPSGGDGFPGLNAFLQSLLGPRGAYPYLGGYLRDEGQPFRIVAEQVEVTGPGRTIEIGDLRIDAVGVPHGPVPALGFVVHAGNVRVAFGGDQRLDDPRFLELARNADLLVAHHAIPQGRGGPAANLHATPNQIGAFTRDAQIRHLVLSHHMARSLAELDTALDAIRSQYDGRLDAANDLDCYAVHERE